MRSSHHVRSRFILLSQDCRILNTVKMLKSLLFASALAGFAAAQETHNGIVYEVRWTNTSAVETTAIKDTYETTAAEQATTRLREALTETGMTPDCLAANTGSTPADLYALKDCIAADNVNNFFTLLADDIEDSNVFWEKVVDESTADVTGWVPARVYVRAYFGSALTATQFAVWMQSSDADADNNDANPEHYYKSTQVTGTTTQASQIFEGWGGVLSSFGTIRTNFTVPDYGLPDFGSADYPNEWSLSSDFNLLFQRIGHKVLTSGTETTFGALHIAVRDVPAEDDGLASIEIYAAVWYPPWDQASDADREEFQGNYLADEAHHMVVEIINLTQQAQIDIAA